MPPCLLRLAASEEVPARVSEGRPHEVVDGKVDGRVQNLFEKKKIKIYLESFCGKAGFMGSPEAA